MGMRKRKFLSVAIASAMMIGSIGLDVSLAVAKTDSAAEAKITLRSKTKVTMGKSKDNDSITCEKKCSVRYKKSNRLKSNFIVRNEDNTVIDVDGIKYRVLTSNGNGGTVALGADLGYKYPSVPKNITEFRIPKEISHAGKKYKVVKLGNNAFMDCDKLRNISIPDSITEIGEGAFRRNYELKTVEMTNSVKKIGGSAFSLCEKLNKITLSDNLIAIGDEAFYSCTALGKVKLPPKLKEISTGLFQNSGIMTVTVPAEVKKIGEKAFWSTENLNNVKFGEKSVCKGIAANAFQFSSIRSIDLPIAVRIIGTKAFNNCRNLSTVGLEKTGGNIVVIGEHAFSSTKLKEFTIASTIREFYESAFSNCGKLQHIEVDKNHPNYVSEDGVLFSKKKDILYVYPIAKGGNEYTVPNTVKVLSCEAFNNCSNLTEVTLPDGLETIKSSALGNMQNLENIHIPASVKWIGKMALSNCSSLKSVELEEGVTGLSSYSFYKLTALDEITIPKSIDIIETGTFGSCESLEKVILKGKKYIKIANSPFIGASPNVKFIVENSKVKELLIKRGIEESKINSLNHEDPVEEFKKDNILYTVLDSGEGDNPGTVQVGNGYSSTGIPVEGNGKFAIPETVTHNGKKYTVVKIAKNAFMQGEEAFNRIKGITVPKTVKEIDDRAFNDCSAMTEIIFEKGSALEEIGKNAFDGSGLKTIKLPESLKVIRENAFKNTRDMKELSLPENLERIDSEAFSGMRTLESITLPKKLKKIGNNITLDCGKLTEIKTAEGNNSFRSKDGVLYTSSMGKLLIYPTGKKDESFVLPNDVREIAKYAFSNVKNLKHFSAGRNLHNIGQNAFAGAPALMSAKFEDCHAEMEDKAFMGCRNLEEITLSKQMTVIPQNLFAQCSSLEELILPESIKEIKRNAFLYASNLNSIKIKSLDIESLPDDLNVNGRRYTVANEDVKAMFVKAGVQDSNVLIDKSLLPTEEVNTFIKKMLKYEVIKPAKGSAKGEVRLVESDREKLGKTLKIPETVSTRGFNYTVTALGSGALYKNETVETLIIPKTVSAIEDSAISGNKRLQEITIPNSVKIIGVNGISDNEQMTSLSFEENSQLETLKNGAFSGNPVVLEIEIPKSVKKMGTHVFFWCNNLKKVSFEEGSSITDIPKGTFFNCFKLEKIFMPQGATSIGEEAFARAGEFTGMDLSKVKSVGKRAFWNCEKIKNAEFSDSLKEIGDGAFSNCFSLEKLALKEGVEKIGDMKAENAEELLRGAFSDCTGLKEVELPKSLQQIGVFTFNGCSSLKKVVMKQKAITGIGLGAFDLISKDAVFYVDNNKIKKALMLSGDILEKQVVVTNPDDNSNNKLKVYNLKKLYKLEIGSKNPKNVLSVKNAEGKVLKLQIKNKKVWKTMFTEKIADKTAKVKIRYPEIWRKKAKTIWRVKIEGDGNNKSYVSRNIVIVQIPKISGLKYNFKVKKNRRVIEDSVKIAPSSIKKKVILQLKTKKGWKKVAVYKMKGERITIKYPNHWKKMKISKWRLYIKPSKRTVGYVTNSIKIKVIK